jgi:hypothetical protein
LEKLVLSIFRGVQEDLAACGKWLCCLGKYRLGNWCIEPVREERIEKSKKKGRR